MPYEVTLLRTIYERTDGYCHICHCKLSFKNYASLGNRGSWEVEHSRPRACGGTDHRNNLFPACIRCNRDKSDFTTRTARKWNGTSRAPYSKAVKSKMRDDNAAAGGILGGLFGLAGGPVGVAFGAAVGAAIGRSIKPPKV
ncbi:MAG TPA: HNH endonuclease signature motif containing protein [Lacipirellulaceae bacterium]|nr:HNH endonuclease signature motif containing protein [Lacipirellulaceae bacterium]